MQSKSAEKIMLQVMNSQQVDQIVSLSEKFGPQVAQQALARVGPLTFGCTSFEEEHIFRATFDTTACKKPDSCSVSSLA